MKLVTPSEIDAANEKLQQIEMKKMAYQQTIAQRIVDERTILSIQVFQYELLQERFEEEKKKELPEADVKKMDEAIAYYKKEEQKKRGIMKELSQILSNMTSVNRIVTILEETE